MQSQDCYVAYWHITSFRGALEFGRYMGTAGTSRLKLDNIARRTCWIWGEMSLRGLFKNKVWLDDHTTEGSL
jgi:hypothetical protein